MPIPAATLPLRLRAALARRSAHPESVIHAVKQRARQLDLIRHYKATGSNLSLGTLMLLQRPLIDRLVKNIPVRAVSRDDLRQEGYLAVAHAARLFDPEAGAAFATFAVHHINAAIRAYIHSNAHAIRLNCHKGVRLFHDYRRHKRAICGDADAMLTTDTVARLAASLGCPVEAIHQAEAYSRIGFFPAIDPDIPVDTSAAEDAETVRNIAAIARRALDILPEASRAVLWHHYLAPEPLSLPAIAARQGIDLKQARRLKRQGLRRLRALMASGIQSVSRS